MSNHKRPEHILSTGYTLNDEIMQLDEPMLLKLIKHEQTNLRRPIFLRRLHSRYNRLRAQREREEL